MTDRELLTAADTADELSGTRFEHAVDHLVASYDTGDFVGAVRLLNAVTDAAEEANHHPDVRLGYGSITFELRSHDVGGVTARDVRLARRIQALADAS